ncbi:MAG: tRNA (N6-isopentenyl adenosine(37)-C2)-methylthiotransferase MiaB [Dehalococcoidia bacterium]|nr:tRNA (N6-isopentenyl adenosine(37)-C2)-methylthiotransferase MiaB [Chloroflexota bacterium]MCK4241918.1 tRNA (N6-isopentenyl adenosine(37)-C2)-methylthiotransferase MiaB [Dehalococcoidia bacterium]
MPCYYIWTIGCQMNKADSERIGSYLERVGFQATRRAEEAEIVVLNSCVVRQSAEDRVINKLGALKSLKRGPQNPILALTGCMVDSRVDGLRNRFSQVDLFFRPQAVGELGQFLGSRGLAAPPKPDSLLPLHPSPSTFVPIIEGCDKFCSYCIVPYRRGRERSRSVDEILCEVRWLVERGVKEVTLLGQNVDSYGHDLPTRPDLADLLAELNRVDSLARIRFLTSHPKDMGERLIEAMAQLEKVCEYLSLPFQAGDDDILLAMRRGYSAKQYRELVERIRDAIPGVALSTDVIVGFPGESEEQFERTLDMICELRFDTVHAACYSPRPGTIATRKLRDDVPLEEKRRRREKIEVLQERIASEINRKLLGQTVEILVEGRKKGKWLGRTRTNKLVFFGDEGDHLGKLVRVEIEKTSPWAFQGSLAG